MAVGSAVTSFFVLVVVLLYSAMVWRSLDQYFRDEFKKHLQQDKNYQKMQQEKLEMLKEMDSMEEKTKFDEGFVPDQKEGCSREKMPADKYKNQENTEDYVDDGEMCPFVLPLSVNDNENDKG